MQKLSRRTSARDTIGLDVVSPKNNTGLCELWSLHERVLSMTNGKKNSWQNDSSSHFELHGD